MTKKKYYLFIIIMLFTQSLSANWALFYESQIFDARLLLSSVNQNKEKTQALVVLDFKEKLFFNGVKSYVVFLEHICGEIKPKIIEEKLYKGEAGKSEIVKINDKNEIINKYIIKTYPKLIKQICI